MSVLVSCLNPLFKFYVIFRNILKIFLWNENTSLPYIYYREKDFVSMFQMYICTYKIETIFDISGSLIINKSGENDVNN